MSHPYQYGAPMGAPTIHPTYPRQFTGRLSIARIRVDSGGYDDDGVYWGVGAPLWRYQCIDPTVNDADRTELHGWSVRGHHRAPTRAALETFLRGVFPLAKT